jgi:hypothetical protein
MSKPVSLNFPCLDMDNIALLEKVSSCFNSWTTADAQANAVCRALIRYDAWCKENESLEAPADALVFFEFLLHLVDDDEWLFVYDLLYPLQTKKEALRSLHFMQNEQRTVAPV